MATVYMTRWMTLGMSDRLEGLLVASAWMMLIPILFVIGLAIGISMLM